MGVFALKDSSNRMLNLFAESSRSGLEAVDASGNLLIRIAGNGEGGNIRFNSKNLQHHWEMDANDNNIFRLYYGTNATHADGAKELSKQFLFNGTNCSITADRFIGVADSAKILTLHDGVTNATTRSTTASTWTGNVSGLRYVWGQAWKDTALGTDTGDLVLGLRAGVYTSGGTELCMMIDGDYYSMGNKVLHAGNYNDYAPTKTGGGASGTWGINVTGSAGSVAWNNITGKPSTFTPSSHNHTSLTGITSLDFSAQSDDGATIKTTIDNKNTYLDFYLVDDGESDLFRWIFGRWDSATSSQKNVILMTLTCAQNANTAKLVVNGTIQGSLDWSYITNKPSSFTPSSHTHSYLPLSGGTMSGDIVFSNSGTAFRSIWGTCGDNDQWRIGGGATGSNSGYMEIATADDGTEPIYVRQYTGVFSSLTRTLTLLDGSGNTSLPGNLNVGGKVELWSDSEGGNIRLTSPNGSWWSIDALNNSSMRFIWAESTVPFSFSNNGTISGTYFTGTAASASNSDTLDGLHAASFMQNGHIGVSNFNSLTTSGVYRFGSAGDYSNPPPNSWGQVLVLHGGGDTINQISCDYSGRNMWMRGGNPSDVGGSGSWYSWGRIWCEGNSVTSAVWNDYAEYRESDCQEFGRVLMEKGDDSLTVTNERLSHFAGISSDTWGFSQGETDKAQTPIAVAGRVLAYPYQDRNNYKPGDCVCAAPNGTVDIMTREEVIQWPDRIVGTVSCVPNYEEWGGGEGADRDPVKVNGRIWIKVK